MHFSSECQGDEIVPVVHVDKKVTIQDPLAYDDEADSIDSSAKKQVFRFAALSRSTLLKSSNTPLHSVRLKMDTSPKSSLNPVRPESVLGRQGFMRDHKASTNNDNCRKKKRNKHSTHRSLTPVLPHTARPALGRYSNVNKDYNKQRSQTSLGSINSRNKSVPAKSTNLADANPFPHRSLTSTPLPQTHLRQAPRTVKDAPATPKPRPPAQPSDFTAHLYGNDLSRLEGLNLDELKKVEVLKRKHTSADEDDQEQDGEKEEVKLSLIVHAADMIDGYRAVHAKNKFIENVKNNVRHIVAEYV